LDEWITTPPVTAIKRARKTTPAHADVFTATIAVRPKRPVRAADPFAIPALAAAKSDFPSPNARPALAQGTRHVREFARPLRQRTSGRF